MRDKIHPLSNQSGQAVVELALMMTFLAMILLALVIIHELGYKNIVVAENLGNEMRKSMDIHASGEFTHMQKKAQTTVDIPGRMKEVFGAPFISQTHKIEFYEGSYQVAGQSIYKNHGRTRLILEKIEVK